MNKCPTCGKALFKAVPGKTTQEEIMEFARHAKLPNAKQILEERWIHPGEYCLNGCTRILINYRNPDLEKKWDEEFEKSHTCHVTIAGNSTLPDFLRDYKIYIDGNIARTGRNDTQPSNGEFARLVPGEHRIVVRESEVKKTNRLESNTIWFTASEGASLHFEVGMANGHLDLIQH